MIKQENNRIKLGNNTLRMFVDRNAILSWEWARVIVRIRWEIVLSNNYFMFNDKIYKQIHGYAMGSPVSPVVANLCMEDIEESAIIASTVPPKVWKRYVDDSFCIIKKDEIPTFHNTLNSMDPHISFTIEQENNGQIPFASTL